MGCQLTVIIPCKDEESDIAGCIHSARKVADEIVVADSGSTDRTLDIVRGLSDVRVIEREYVNSGDFKNWAIPQGEGEWVLILDADERIPDTLAVEIKRVLADPHCDGYWIYRAGYFMGHRVRFSGWQNDRVLRLFRRDAGAYRGNTDHAEVVITSGRVGRLKHRLLHFTYWTYADYLQRLRRYATYQAQQWHVAERPVSRIRLVLNFPLRFLQLYVLRLGFLDGLVGFQICMLTAFYSFLKQACLWQCWQGRSPVSLRAGVKDVVVADDVVAEDSSAASIMSGTGRRWHDGTTASEMASRFAAEGMPTAVTSDEHHGVQQAASDEMDITQLSEQMRQWVRFLETTEQVRTQEGDWVLYARQTGVTDAGLLADAPENETAANKRQG